ncbi:MAG: L-threonylcarbamoyladenylate synthase [Faecousia sp.]
MKTLILPASDPSTVIQAAEIIRAGGLVAIPTETVYGLGANAMDEEAVAKIFLAKGRPQDNPLIIHISCAEELTRYCHDIPEAAWRLAERFWPGPLTMVLPVNPCVPKRTTAGLSTVAVRCPKTQVTRELICVAGVPIAAPSANLSGKPSTTTAAHVLHDYGTGGRIDAIIDGGPCEVGVESTIVDLTGEKPRLLRPGGITPEELRDLLGELEIDRAVLAQISDDTVVRAPGMKYKHYAPSAEVYIVSGSSEAAAAYVRRRFTEGDAVLCFEEELPLFAGCNPTAYGKYGDMKTLSAGLFAALRELDRPEIKTIYARCPEGGGIACAVGNRLKKAAAFRVVDPEADQ